MSEPLRHEIEFRSDVTVELVRAAAIESLQRDPWNSGETAPTIARGRAVGPSPIGVGSGA